MRTFLGLCVLAVCALGCAPGVTWAPAPEGTKVALVADGTAPIRAYTVTPQLTLTFGNDAVEVAYYDRPLAVLGLEEGVIEIDADGAPLAPPNAVFERAGGGAPWVERTRLGPRLETVRVAQTLPQGCWSFDQEAPELVAQALRFMVRADADHVLIGNVIGEVYVIDSALGAPAPVTVRVANGAEPIFSSGRRVDGPFPFLLGAFDGGVWKGRFEAAPPTLEIDRVTTVSSGEPITRIDGTLEPVDIHVLVNAGFEPTEPAAWDRFDGVVWRSVGEVPQMRFSSHYDLFYRSPSEVYATALVAPSAVRRFDGTSVVQEDAPPMISVAYLEDFGVVGGSYDSVYVREAGRWRRLREIANEAFPDEAPHAFLDYPGGAVLVGKSYLSQMVGETTCPTTYLWPSFRFSFVERFGENIVAGTNGHPESAPLTYLRPRR